MKKHICRIFGILLMGLALCGCNSDIPDLTEEQTAMITEYATNLLVKHSELSDRSLLSETELEVGIQEEAEERVRKDKAAEIAESYLDKEVEMVEGTDGLSTDNEGNSLDENVYASSLSVSEFFEEDDFSIEYITYDLCDSYPEESGEDFFMAMDATQGHQLCVVKFDVRNTTSSEQELDMLSKKGRFTLHINNADVIQAQATMLLDDLSSYKGTIAANSGEEMVLVFEVDDDVDRNATMKLTMKGEMGENSILLD